MKPSIKRKLIYFIIFSLAFYSIKAIENKILYILPIQLRKYIFKVSGFQEFKYCNSTLMLKGYVSAQITSFVIWADIYSFGAI